VCVCVCVRARARVCCVGRRSSFARRAMWCAARHRITRKCAHSRRGTRSSAP
jgi:hypothetical protein